MREIKFRGKRLDNGEWVYGDLVQIEGSYIYDYDIGDNGVEQKPILSQIKWNVNPETVGQYTGLKDKNGKEIYEGDICEMPHVIQEGYKLTEDGKWRFQVVCAKDGRWEAHNGIGFRFAYGIEVIGNIYDNPEL